MKTFLIFLLGVLLLASAVFTRPSEVSLRDYLTDAPSRTRPSVTLPGPPGGPLSESETDAFLAGCTISDRILWVSVQKDGRTLYTGAFAHWFPHAHAQTPPPVASTPVTELEQ